ncbi:DUF4376 domain-containing protein [Bradyrhizobium elkanii]|uniref:DUF4376 domain-containing protein n=1 Tax=Bradyrhizobium elkanii TaxID=29448 RepID=UPI0004AF4FFA|nr:DUF4376 domain-containing protein [Bradyrhizobium elkanii]
MPLIFDARDWYWFVGGDTTKVYSSARNVYVDPASDSNYATWRQNQSLDQAPPIATEEDIWGYVQAFQPLWLWDSDAKLIAQPAEGQYTKQQLRNYNATVRFNKVTGGMTAAGVPIKTDDRSRNFIQGGRAAAVDDATFTTKWYGSDGNFYDVDAATMKSMADALGKHTNDCYTVFSQTDDGIVANTITTLAQIDTAYQGL